MTEIFIHISPILAFFLPLWGWIALVVFSLAIPALLWFVKWLNLTEKSVQETVHKLEEGAWKKWVILAAVIAPVIFQLTLWFYGISGDGGFHGLWHPRAFEQAEIAREIARGHGFSTKIIRPAELAQFEANSQKFPLDRMPDTYHAPLWPSILAPFVWLARDKWVLSPRDYAYVSDKILAGVASAFFLLSVVVNYFFARRLFDHRLALMVVALTLLCDRLWQFSMSGLPQMLLLFLFSCAAYTLLRAIEIHCRLHPVATGHFEDEEGDEVARELPVAGDPTAPSVGDPAETPMQTAWLLGPEPWLLATALLFGFMALAHGLTIWIFVAAVIFCAVYFRVSWRVLVIMLSAFLLVYSPWLIRNYGIYSDSGRSFANGMKGIGGLAWYSLLSGIQGSEGSLMRSMAPLSGGFGASAIPRKALAQAYEQFESIYAYLGCIVVAPVFFVSLLHVFKRREIAVFRWLTLLLWFGALVGMSAFGMDDQALHANDLWVLFIPLTSMYGMAFVLVLWSRVEISHIRLIHRAFVFLLFLVSDRPIILTFSEMVSGPRTRVQWPPYVPPFIAILGTWTSEKEILVSDMPWAVAWYADRRCLWLPDTVGEFRDLYDYKFTAPIVGLYLTPVSGDRPFLTDIIKGDYKEWAPFIMHSPSPKGFPLHASTAMPIENMCVVYFDRDRWTNKED